MIQYLKAHSIHEHGVCDRWCEPDSWLMSLGCGASGAGGPPPAAELLSSGRSGSLWEKWSELQRLEPDPTIDNENISFRDSDILSSKADCFKLREF